MRWLSTSLRSGGKWWWLFAVFVATPATVLALLGVRIVELEQMERSQQISAQQRQLANLIDAALSNTFKDLETALPRAESTRTVLADLILFTSEPNGRVIFPRENLFFGGENEEIVRKPRQWSANVLALI